MRAGKGPFPYVLLTFKLSAEPQLGLFQYVSESWSFAQSVYEAKKFFQDVDGEVCVSMRLRRSQARPVSVVHGERIWEPIVSLEEFHAPSFKAAPSITTEPS